MTLVPVLVATVAGTLMVPLLGRLIQRGRPFEAFDQRGAIRPDRATAWAGLVLSALAILVGLRVIADGDFEGSKTGGIVCLLLGPVMGAIALARFSDLNIVRWDETGVSGPSAGPWSFRGRTSNIILWDEIATVDRSASGNWYIEARDRRRIYWGYTHKGSAWLAAALRRKRPELALPHNMKVAA